jgi:hypothetical protein
MNQALCERSFIGGAAVKSRTMRLHLLAGQAEFSETALRLGTVYLSRQSADAS